VAWVSQLIFVWSQLGPKYQSFLYKIEQAENSCLSTSCHVQLQFLRLSLKAQAAGNLGEISAIRVAI
jgi:hypothetical protein